jgi:hypothetical protein
VGGAARLADQAIALSGFAVTLAISGVLGVLSGRWRSLAAPVLCGLTIGVISAATVAGDLGRGR